MVSYFKKARSMRYPKKFEIAGYADDQGFSQIH